MEPDSDYVLILDTDLIVRKPFLPKQLHVRPGFARSAEFGYMKGASYTILHCALSTCAVLATYFPLPSLSVADGHLGPARCNTCEVQIKTKPRREFKTRLPGVFGHTLASS